MTKGQSMDNEEPQEGPHDGRHYNCAPCFKIKCESIQFQGIEAGQRRFTDKERGRDVDAYKRLRKNGVQPQHVFGSAEVEAGAMTKFEAEHQVIMSNSVRKEFIPTLEEAAK